MPPPSDGEVGTKQSLKQHSRVGQLPHKRKAIGGREGNGGGGEDFDMKDQTNSHVLQTNLSIHHFIAP